MLAFEGKGVRRAFGLGAILPAAFLPFMLLSQISESPHLTWVPAWPWLWGDIRLAIIPGRVMATITWPLALACGTACAAVWWLLTPSQRDPAEPPNESRD